MAVETPLTEIIDHEIEEKGISAYLNNFTLRLPWNGYTHIADDPYMKSGPYRETSELLGDLDCINRDRYTKTDEEAQHYSELLLSQTPREFYQTIDSIVSELGLNETIERMSKTQREINRKFVDFQFGRIDGDFDSIADEGTTNLRNFNLHIKSIYVELRKRGYNHSDLTL